ncbi:MAG TPA: T9SS type A sorting domain-containing protein [Bacteroidales bacterium]|nr:T9SS type A sorting domain-containing protein [Bacteroidales bacterium]
MKKPLALFFIINLFFTSLYAQSIISSLIYDSINNTVLSGDTIQLNCANPSIVLSSRIFAPGATNNYVVESIPYNPPFSFDLNEYPDRIYYHFPYDDVWSQVMDFNFGQPSNSPSFNFSFYGQNTLNHYVIGSNGLLSFDTTVASGTDFFTNNASSNLCEWSLPNNPIPNQSIYKNCIFGPYHDMDFQAANGVGEMYFKVIGEYPYRKFVLSFYDVPLFSCPSQRVTTMLVLYETINVIEFYMQDKPICPYWNGGKAILGIQNVNGTQATVVSNYNLPNQWQATNEAWRIRPNSELNYSSKWFKRSISSNNRIEVSSTNGSINAYTDSIEGGQYYILETSFYTLNGDTITISDSCLVLPQTALANSQYGTTINAKICGGETYSLNGFSENLAGNYSRIVQTSNGCDSTIILNLLVDTIQVPTNLTIISDTNYLQLEWEGNGETYIIYRDGDSIESTTQRIYIDSNVVHGINYCYKLRAINTTCESELSNRECAMLLNLNGEIDSKISISLYPNPTNDKVRIEIKGLNHNIDIIVYDINAKIINNCKYIISDKKLEIDFNGVSSGIYYIKLCNKELNITKKIIVQ